LGPVFLPPHAHSRTPHATCPSIPSMALPTHSDTPHPTGLHTTHTYPTTPSTHAHFPHLHTLPFWTPTRGNALPFTITLFTRTRTSLATLGWRAGRRQDAYCSTADAAAGAGGGRCCAAYARRLPGISVPDVHSPFAVFSTTHPAYTTENSGLAGEIGRLATFLNASASVTLCAHGQCCRQDIYYLGHTGCAPPTTAARTHGIYLPSSLLPPHTPGPSMAFRYATEKDTHSCRRLFPALPLYALLSPLPALASPHQKNTHTHSCTPTALHHLHAVPFYLHLPFLCPSPFSHCWLDRTGTAAYACPAPPHPPYTFP